MKIKLTMLASALAVGGALLQTHLAVAQPGKPSSVVGLNEFRTQLTLLQADIAGTVSSLNLVKQSAKKPAELSKAVEELGTRFKSMEDRVEMLRTNATTAKARVKAHYEAWAKELTAMQNANLRESHSSNDLTGTNHIIDLAHRLMIPISHLDRRQTHQPPRAWRSHTSGKLISHSGKQPTRELELAAEINELRSTQSRVWVSIHVCNQRIKCARLYDGVVIEEDKVFPLGNA